MPIKVELQVDFKEFALDINLDLPDKGVTTLFGTSGAGKSTVLRCIAGLEQHARGLVQVGDDIWLDSRRNVTLPTHRRALGYVFQEPRLFAHLTVQQNLEYGYKRTPESERYLKFDDVIGLLGIGHLLSRKPQKLSGGEQQRVAIGRALLASPKLLLMDEPLAALDVARKQEVLPFIRALHNELDIPVIYVSHSLDEVLQITDTMVLMSKGKNIATGPITELCSTLELTQYLGDMSGSVINACVETHEEEFGLSCLAFEGGQIYVPQLSLSKGQTQRIHILARNVGIALQKPQETTSFLNVLEAMVTEVAVPDIRSHAVQVKLDVGVPLLANISRKSLYTLRLEPGQKCFALIKAVSLSNV